MEEKRRQYEEAERISLSEEVERSVYARVVFIDATGKRRDLQRGAASKAHAREVLQQLLVEIEATDGRSVETEKKTFADLTDYFRAHYATPAEYAMDGNPLAGGENQRHCVTCHSP